MTLLDPRVWIAALLIAVAGFGLGYVKGNTNGKAKVQAQWDAAKAQQAQIAASATAADTTAGQQASNSYQGVISNEKERIKVIRETVIRTVTGPCFDERGVGIINNAIKGGNIDSH